MILNGSQQERRGIPFVLDEMLTLINWREMTRD